MDCTSWHVFEPIIPSVRVSKAHIALQVVFPHIWFDPDQVPQHPRHQVLSEYYDFLFAKLDAAGIRRKVNLRYS